MPKIKEQLRLEGIRSRPRNKLHTPTHKLEKNKSPRSRPKSKLWEIEIEAEAATRAKLNTTMKPMGMKS